MDMSVGVLDHYNVSTRKLPETIRFYEEVLGFKNGPRPPFNFPGAWLYSAGHPGAAHQRHLADRPRAARRFRRDRSRGVRQPRLRGDEEASRRPGHRAPRQPGAEQHPLADFPPRPEQRGDRAEFRNQERDRSARPWRSIFWSASRPARGCSAPPSCCARRASISSSATSTATTAPTGSCAISPHKKVPVISIDNKVSLFESNAIAEYLDETITPRLHPEDPVQRAINRAWTDYLPTFSEMVTGQAYSEDEAEYKRRHRENPAGVREARRRAEDAERAGAVLQRREVFAGRCRLCAVPAALLLPRSHQAARRDREVPAGEGLGRGADEAAVDAFVPGGGVRGALSAEREAAEEISVAVHRRRRGGGGIGAALGA